MGVDYSSSSLNIADNHASYIENFLKKNNVMQKRTGWEQILGIKDNQSNISFNEEDTINGIWNIKYKSQIVTIAHIGTEFYFVNNFETNDFNKIELALIGREKELNVKNEKSFGVVANDRIYVLCGTYLVIKMTYDNNIIGANISRVYNDTDTYVPTTTIGITPQEAQSSVLRTSYDDINMLSPYRINTLLSVDYDSEEENKKYTYVLDGKVKIKSISASGYYIEEPVKVNIQYINKEYNAKVSVNYISVTEGTGESTSINGRNYVVVYLYEENAEHISENRKGFITINGDEEDNSILVLYDYYKPPVEAQDNVTVTFLDNRVDESNLIENCTFGILYGAGNNRNRLFVAGNPNTPNVDYRSSQRNIYANEHDTDLLENQDYTYFSVKDYCNYGTSNSAIMGYQIMGDGSLMVLKEKMNTETTIYFRKGTYVNKAIYYGDGLSTEVYVDMYPLSEGNIGEGLIAKNSLFNLNNDIVFLSKNGVFGISATISASSLASDYKYAYSRSRLINKELLKYDLSNAKCCMFDNKLFITVKNNKQEYITFVADGRYRFALNDSVDNEYEYEWFVLKNLNVDNFYVLNEKLYFSNKNGLFYWDMYSDNYKDITHAKVRTMADCEIDSNDYSDINFNKDFFEKYVNETTTLKFNKQYYGLLFEVPANPTIENGWYIIEKPYNSFKDEMKTYDSAWNTPIYIQQNPYNENQFKFYLDKEYTTEMSGIENTNIVYELDTQEYKYRIKVDETNPDKTYILGDNDEIIYFPRDANETVGLNISLKSYNLIECYYVTKSYNFGQSTYSKILRTLTITNDTELYSKVHFAILTKDQISFNKNVIDLKRDYVSGTNGLTDTYENIFKADLTNKTFASSFTKDFLMKFNYIQFAFYNKEDENCVFNNLSILYTYGFKQKGAH